MTTIISTSEVDVVTGADTPLLGCAVIVTVLSGSQDVEVTVCVAVESASRLMIAFAVVVASVVWAPAEASETVVQLVRVVYAVVSTTEGCGVSVLVVVLISCEVTI